MQWSDDGGADLISKKARETSSKLRAAGIAGIKNLASRPASLPSVNYVKQEPKRTAELFPRNSGPLKSERDAISHQYFSNPLLNNCLSSDIQHSNPQLEDQNWYENGNTIASQSTPVNKVTDRSVWPSHRSLLLSEPSISPRRTVAMDQTAVSPLSSGYRDSSGFHRPASSPPHQTKSKLNNYKHSSNALPNENDNSVAFQPSTVANQKASWSACIITSLSSQRLLVLALFGIFCYALITFISNTKIESHLIQKYGRDMKPWLKVFNAAILRELDEVDHQST